MKKRPTPKDVEVPPARTLGDWMRLRDRLAAGVPQAELDAFLADRDQGTDDDGT